MEATARIAMLIDADNASARTLDYVLGEIASLGVANVRRAYGDWGSPRLGGWREALLSNAIQPMQQVAYTSKGNASDMAMVIDAMDLMHSGDFDAFALMSSDSDFTPLVMRLRAANMRVYGFGKANTPNAFKVACSVFFDVEAQDDMTPPPEPAATQKRGTKEGKPESACEQPTVRLVKPPSRKTGAELRSDTSLLNLLRNAVQAKKGEDGWSNIGAVAQHLVNRGGFTPKNYGYSALKPLLVATELFEIRSDGNHVRPAGQGAKKTPKPSVATAMKRVAKKTSKRVVQADPD